MLRTITIVFLSIVASSLELKSKELPLYGTITTDEEIYFYINTGKYIMGEKLRIEISFECDCSIRTLSILYCQMNGTSPGYMEASSSREIPSKKYSTGLTVQMKEYSNYYIFKTPTINNCDYYPLMTINHVKTVFDYQFPLYSKGAVSRQSSIYLDIRTYKKNDNITFKLLFTNGYNYNNVTLKYVQSYYSTVSASQYTDIQSFIRSNSGELDIFYFQINLERDPASFKYLFLLLPEDIYKYSNATIWHTDNMPIIELKEYGEVQVSEQSCLYLALDNFSYGDIYLELSYINQTKSGFKSLPLPYYFSNETTSNTFGRTYLIDNKFSSVSNISYTYYYTVQKTFDAKYLVLYTPFFKYFNDTKVTVKNNIEEKKDPNKPEESKGPEEPEGSKNVILYFSVGAGIFLMVYIIVICIVKRNRRKNNIEDSSQDKLKKMVEVSPELNEPIPID
jgi:hypothetical protein